MSYDPNSILSIAKLLAGYPKDQIDLANFNGLKDVAQAVMVSANRLEGFEQAIQSRDDANDIRQAVFSVDPAYTPDDDPARKLLEIYHDDQILLMPELPALALPTPQQESEANASAAWLNTYTNYAHQRAPMLPREFHESAGLWLLSLAIARRLMVAMPHDNIYPNLFILWVASTTIYSKSTGLKISREIAEEAMPYLLLSNEFSPEGLLDDMAGKPPPNLMELPDVYRNAYEQSRKFSSRRGLVLDEASSLFAGLKKDYNTGLAEALMRFYDCSNHRGRTRGRGMAIVKDSYLCFLGATTETGIRQADITGLWTSGLWPRFGLLVPTEKPQFKRFVTPPTRPEELVTHLQNISNEWLPQPKDTEYPPARGVCLGTGVFDAWANYDKAIFSVLLSDTPPGEHLFGIYGRLPTQALKISTCLAVADWDGENQAPTIQLPHWHRAQLICEQWRAGAHQLYYNLTGIAEDDSFERRLLNRIAKFGETGITIRELYRAERRKREDIEPVINRLVREGLLDEYKPQGKKTEYYRLIGYCQT